PPRPRPFPYPTPSDLLMQAAIGDALAIALLEGRGFTALEFANFHPGGKLGAMLKHISDLMRSGDAVPLKPLGTGMADALAEMSADRKSTRLNSSHVKI